MKRGHSPLYIFKIIYFCCIHIYICKVIILGDGMLRNRIILTEIKNLKIYSIPQDSEPWIKPLGFWYGFGQDWVHLNRHKLNATYKFVLSLDESKILTLVDKHQIHEFTDEYGVELRGSKIMHIDWLKVSHEYAGIEILAKLHDYNPKHDWLYYWEATGCVWDKEAIKTVKALEEHGRQV